ncbi:MAG: hypothetical protein P4L65_04470 [Legionella sp.]|nr:hypothetical protein [Legionella sp.]
MFELSIILLYLSGFLPLKTIYDLLKNAISLPIKTLILIVTSPTLLFNPDQSILRNILVMLTVNVLAIAHFLSKMTLLVLITPVSLLVSFAVGLRAMFGFGRDTAWSRVIHQEIAETVFDIKDLDIDIDALKEHAKAFWAAPIPPEIIYSANNIIPSEDIEQVLGLKLAQINSPADLLDSKQLKEIEKFLIQISSIDRPLPLEVKQEAGRLKTKFENYTDLNKRLNKLMCELVMEEHESIEDEIIPCTSVTNPIFFAKQFKKNGVWYHAPAEGRITEKSSMIQWITPNEDHPSTRENIANPPLYKDHEGNMWPTRFVWHELSAESCFAGELTELVSDMSVIHQKLSTQLKGILNEPVGSGLSSYSMFKSNNPNVPSAPVAEPDPEESSCCFSMWKAR